MRSSAANFAAVQESVEPRAAFTIAVKISGENECIRTKHVIFGKAHMEYTDLCIAPERLRIFPVTADAIYYVTADARYRIAHAAIPESMVLAATLRGHGEIRINGKTLALNAGDIAAFSAGDPFAYRCTGVSWSFWWFEFRCLDPHFPGLPLETVLPVPFNEGMLYLCHEALHNLKLKDSQAASVLLAALLCLLRKESAELSQPNGTLALFREADQYIHRNLASATVESTARYLNVSTRTLLKVFRTLLGISTTEYIQNMKMDMARHLLTASPYTIREISEQLGYGDSFSFSKSFHRHFAVSPREYRKKNAQ